MCLLLGHGLFVKQECTTTTDTVCDVLSGYFCKEFMDDIGCSLAQKHTHCAPGERIKEPGKKKNSCLIVSKFTCTLLSWFGVSSWV